MVCTVNNPQQNVDSLGEGSQSHVVWSQGADNIENNEVQEQYIGELDPDDGYATEIGTQPHTSTQGAESGQTIYNNATDTYRIVPDEFMGQFDDIDELAYPIPNDARSQVENSNAKRTMARTVLAHEKPHQVYQSPLRVHRVQEKFGANSTPKKAFPPPQWPVDEINPNRRQAPRTATITSIFHEDEVVSGYKGGTKHIVPDKDKTKTYKFSATYPDITGEKDLFAGNRRRPVRNPPNRGRQ